MDSKGDVIALQTSSLGADYGSGVMKGTMLMKFDASGKLLWIKRFGQAGTDVQSLVACVDGAGDVILGGQSSGPIDFGGGPLPGGGFIVKCAPSGTPLWTKSTSASVFYVAGDPAGSVIVASAQQNFDLGTGPLLAGVDGFAVVKLAP